MTTLSLMRHANSGWTDPGMDDHEPGLGALLPMLGGRAAAPGLRRAYSHFPTAAVAVLKVDIGDWRDLGADRVEFVAFAVPRELMENRAPGA